VFVFEHSGDESGRKMCSRFDESLQYVYMYACMYICMYFVCVYTYMYTHTLSLSLMRASARAHTHTVAIKVVDKMCARFDESLLESEINTMMQCEHPNCVTLFQVSFVPLFLHPPPLATQCGN
jgi:hypothetical protein